MRRYTVVRLFLSLVVALAYAGPSGRIIGGTEAPDGAYPYMAILKIRGELQCGASILNKNWLLTAAHCVSQLDGKTTHTTVVVGTNNRLSGGDEYKVKHYVSHPKFEDPATMYNNDVALLQVSEEIQFNEKVKPIALPANKLKNYENSVATLSGWGILNLAEGLEIPQALQHINLTVYNQQKCKGIWLESPQEIEIDDGNICAFTKQGEGACYGDSGSPLVVAGTQVGISSFVQPCAQGYPDVFTRISNFLDWINEYTTYEINA